MKTMTATATALLLFATANAHAWNKAPTDTPKHLKGTNVIEGRVGWFAKSFGAGKPYFFVDKGIAEANAKYSIKRCGQQLDAAVNRNMDLYGTIIDDVYENHHSCLNRHGVHVLYRGPDNKLTVYAYRDLLREY